MATRTSVGSGLFSAAGTWDTGVPLDGDTVIVDTGHTVTFDVDQSGFATGVDLTVTGTLQCSTLAGTYYLKCSADIDGAGTFQAGSAGTALPSTVTFTIDLNGGNKIDLSGGMSLLLYCTQPANPYIRLSAAEAAGQTALSVDTDVTSDTWADGDTIHVNDINRGREVDERVIAGGGIAAAEITVTVGLTNAKLEDALVVLVTRNIRIIGATGININGGSNAVLQCEINGGTCAIKSGTGHTLSGVAVGQSTEGCSSITSLTMSGVISNMTGGSAPGIDACTGVMSGVISGCARGLREDSDITVSGLVSGCTTGFHYAYWDNVISGIIEGCGIGITNHAINSGVNLMSGTIRNCGIGIGGVYARFIITGTITDCTTGIYRPYLVTLDGATISNCTYGISQGTVVTIGGVTFSGNTNDIYYTRTFTAYNTAFGGVTEFNGYNAVQRGKVDYAESFDHDQVADAFRAWCRGGVVNSNGVVVPSGKPLSYNHVCEDADYPCYRQGWVRVEPGDTLTVTCDIRKDATMSYLPRVQIVDPYSDPLVDSGNSALDEDIMTNSIDTWESLECTWENTGNIARWVLFRVLAQDAANNVYEYVETDLGGGSGTIFPGIVVR